MNLALMPVPAPAAMMGSWRSSVACRRSRTSWRVYGFPFPVQGKGEGGVWTLSFPDQIFQILIFLIFFLGPRDPFKITLGTISNRSVPVAPLGMVWSSSYEGFCVFCFHHFFPFFMEGEKYFGGKMNPPGGFSTEERKEFLRRGSDGGVTPPPESRRNPQSGSEGKKIGPGRGSGFRKIVQPPPEEGKGGAGGGWGVQLRVGHVIYFP